MAICAGIPIEKDGGRFILALQGIYEFPLRLLVDEIKKTSASLLTHKVVIQFAGDKNAEGVG